MSALKTPHALRRTPYAHLLDWTSKPGMIFPKKWFEVIRMLPNVDHWRKDKRQVNRAVRLIQREQKCKKS